MLREMPYGIMFKLLKNHNRDKTMKKYLYLTVFISGMTSLAIEMAASRLLGSVFGTSNLVWASIIGLILIYLSAGNFVGGKWADKSPKFETFFKILIWASVLIVIVPTLSRPVLRLAANAFDSLNITTLAGSFIAVIILLSIPITLLGTASPFAIRLAIKDTQDVGKISGKIYAISTLGSFIGTFLPVLILIPTIGTYRTFISIGAVLLVFALIGLWRFCGFRAALPYLWTLLLIPAILLWGLPGSDKQSIGQIYETESSYNYIQVIEQDSYRMLRLNEGQGIHSIYHPTDLNYSGAWQQVLVAPFFNQAPHKIEEVKSMAIVGLAAGTTARQATAVYGPIPIDGYEIDPKIVEVGYDYFGMDLPNLNVFVEDGRWGLEHSTKKYDVISIDAYRPPYIPFHMTTQEFFEIVHNHLTDEGVLVINVGRSPQDRQLIDGLSTTMQTVFPSIHVVDVPNTFNSIVFATVQPTNSANLADNLIYLNSIEDVNPLLMTAMGTAVLNMGSAPEMTTVFTDDIAPIEWITNNLVLQYLITDQPEF
jgi:predicted membrane-bound spermidine synthase